MAREKVTTRKLLDLQVSFKDWLVVLMETYGLDAVEIAKRTAVTDKTVYEWLKGKGPMRADETRTGLLRSLGIAQNSAEPDQLERARYLLLLEHLVLDEYPEMHGLNAPERRFCVFLAYALMTMLRTDRDRFGHWASEIMRDVKGIDSSEGGRLLRELLIVKGGKQKR